MKNKTHRKIVSLQKALAIRQSLKKVQKKLVFTNGCFDILHFGHVAYLRAARKLGDVLLVGVNRDASIKRLKGPARPINKERHRAGVLAALECVDYVVLFAEDTPERLICTLSPDVLVKGSDWRRGQIVGESHLATYGGVVRRIRLQKGLSTTRLIEKMESLS